MAQAKELKSKQAKAYEAYLGLPSESYEFIARTMSMQDWLRKAHAFLQQNQDLGAEETYGALHDSFDKVYNNMFAMFMRPYRLLSPLELFRQPSEDVRPGAAGDAFLGWMKILGEAQTRFMKATADAFLAFSGSGERTSEADNDVTGELLKITPFNLLRHFGAETSEAYFETLGRMARHVGENQFMFPKQFFVALQEVADSYPRARRAGQKYEALIHDTWEKAVRQFMEEVKGRPGPAAFNDFFKVYIKVFSSEFNKLMALPEFIEAQTEFANVTSGTISALRSLTEAQLEMYPFLPLTMRKETDALEQRVHSYRRRLDSMERKMRAMEKQLKAAVVRPMVEEVQREAVHTRKISLTKEVRREPVKATHGRQRKKVLS